MATIVGNRTEHATLTATTVDTVTLNAPQTKVKVVNRHATEVLWVTISRTGTAPADPTIGGDDTYFVAPANGSETFYSRSGVIVKVLGNGNGYSIHGFDLGLP
jgi:hypothetical protein